MGITQTNSTLVIDSVTPPTEIIQIDDTLMVMDWTEVTPPSRLQRILNKQSQTNAFVQNTEQVKEMRMLPNGEVRVRAFVQVHDLDKCKLGTDGTLYAQSFKQRKIPDVPLEIEEGKLFVVNDILPATTQLRISWERPLEDWLWVKSWGTTTVTWVDVGVSEIRYRLRSMKFSNVVRIRTEDRSTIPYTVVYLWDDDIGYYSICGTGADESCETTKHIIIDTSDWTEDERIISFVDTTCGGDSPADYGLRYLDLNE